MDDNITNIKRNASELSASKMAHTYPNKIPHEPVIKCILIISTCIFLQCAREHHQIFSTNDKHSRLKIEKAASYKNPVPQFKMDLFLCEFSIHMACGC